jgi:gas vesicle protein
MLSLRFLFGALVGGAAVYFFDPDNGAERRARLRSGWEQNREPIMDSATKAASAAQERASRAAAAAQGGASQLSEQARGLKAKVSDSTSSGAGSQEL